MAGRRKPVNVAPNIIAEVEYAPNNGTEHPCWEKGLEDYSLQTQESQNPVSLASTAIFQDPFSNAVCQLGRHRKDEKWGSGTGVRLVPSARLDQ